MHPGSSRSRIARNHALLAPESHVRTTLPGWEKTATVVLISPHMGAAFTQYLAHMEKSGRAGAPAEGAQRFVYVQSGGVRVSVEKRAAALKEGGFAYFPANCEHAIQATRETTLIVFEKPYERLGPGRPMPIIGSEQGVQGAAFMGDPDAMLKELLPSDPSMDFAMNVFEFKPGGTLPLVEVHYMEHGLSFLSGQGVYRLDESWYPVQAGDTIWMGPYCPQWFVAAGKTNSRYLYYKNMHRHPNGAVQP